MTVLSHDDTIQRALRLHAHAGRSSLTARDLWRRSEWHLLEFQIQKVLEAFWLHRRRHGSSVSGGAGASPDVATPSARVHSFLAAVAQGMPVAAALAAFAQVGRGQFSHGDACAHSGAQSPRRSRIIARLHSAAVK